MSSSVTVVERVPLYAKKTTLSSSFILGPFDQIAGFVPIQVVWLYEAHSDREIVPTPRLQRALELLLSYYPHLTGRIHVDPGSGIRQITDSTAGAELLLATCSERLDAFDAPSPGRIMALPGAGNALLAPFDPNPAKSASQPILAVQHTRFVCGSVSLGIRMAHTICDGDGYFQLVRNLARLYRGLSSSDSPSLSYPPRFEPHLVELIGAATSAQEDSLYEPTVLGTKPHSNPPFVLPQTPVGRFLRFTREQLSDLKARATEPGGGSWVSTFEALAAHLYRRVYRARLKLFAQDPTLGTLSAPDFLTPVNTRPRLGISHPENYFPNALFTSFINVDPPELERLGLTDGPLWKTAKAIHDLTRSSALTDTSEITNTLRWIARQPDMKKIQSGFRYGTGSFMFSAWSKFDYMNLEFDEGVPPVLACPPFTASSTMDGLAYSLPPERGAKEGDIDVNLVLIEPVWRIFESETDW
ncbi:transferase [Mycena amicta]|nr:transferase [Mycena amicta]